MAFGVKVKTVKTSNKYTIESFYEAIKDKKFTAVSLLSQSTVLYM